MNMTGAETKGLLAVGADGGQTKIGRQVFFLLTRKKEV